MLDGGRASVSDAEPVCLDGPPPAAFGSVQVGEQVVLDLVELVGTSLLPAAVGRPAEVTTARGDAVWVESGVLVERDGVGRV